MNENKKPRKKCVFVCKYMSRCMSFFVSRILKQKNKKKRKINQMAN